jgi:hypothetical protein
MIRGVRIVTFHALAFGDHFVRALGFLGDHGLVAPVADLIRIGSQQLSVRGRVRIVTPCAFSRLDGSVHKRTLQFLLETVVTIQAQRSLGAGLQFEFVLAIRRRKT